MTHVTTPRAEHVCWSYEDPADFRSFATGFLRAGADSGELVWSVGAAAVGIRADRHVDLADTYGADAVLDPAAQVAAYAAATEAALAAGYTGLRVAADVSALVRTPAQLDAFARYEFAISRYMLSAPMSAVCGYDRTVLGDAAIAEVACLHPRSSAGTASFHLHPSGPEPGEVYLDGELDAASEELFATALRRTGTGRPGRPILVDAGQLRYIDHRGLLNLQRYAGLHATTAVVRTPRAAVGVLAGLLDLDRVRVEVVV